MTEKRRIKNKNNDSKNIKGKDHEETEKVKTNKTNMEKSKIHQTPEKRKKIIPTSPDIEIIDTQVIRNKKETQRPRKATAEEKKKCYFFGDSHLRYMRKIMEKKR